MTVPFHPCCNHTSQNGLHGPGQGQLEISTQLMSQAHCSTWERTLNKEFLIFRLLHHSDVKLRFAKISL